MKADTFFSEEEKHRIEQAIDVIESRTIGEVAVMVVDRSDDYREAGILGGLFLGSLLSLVIALSWFHASIWAFILFSVLLFFPARNIFQQFPVLQSGFIGLKRKEVAVMQRAVRAFYEKGLYKTKKSTGVLFFISLLERKVWVLADKGIYEKIDQVTLNHIAHLVSTGIMEGRACDALCSSIGEAGGLLAKYFPVSPGDTDELPDQVMTE
jgi:putative membrane protein